MHIDFETYSEAGYRWGEAGRRWRSAVPSKPGIAAVGAWIYAAHPTADIISIAYDGTVWIPGMMPPQDLFDYIADGGLCWAWNSFFEFAIWHNVAVKKYGWPPLPLHQLRCAQARGLGWGLPSKLEKAGDALALDILKDKAGGPLIKKLCCPRSPTKKNPLHRLTPESNPDDFARFYDYNLQDIHAEAAITAKTPPLLPQEEAVWLLDQRINARGVHIDRPALEACVAIFYAAESKYTEELQQITGGHVRAVGEVAKLAAWLSVSGAPTASVDKENVERMLGGDLPPACRRALEIRQVLGSSSVKKLFALQRYLAPDSRVRGLFQYCGAERTGRWAGRGPQPQNMPNSGPEVKACRSCGLAQWGGLATCRRCGADDLAADEWGPDAVDLALADIATRDLAHVEASWGDPLAVISGCLRGLFTSAPGCDLLASDYSAIEAVVLAVLAGEEWRVEVFRTHGKIYEMSAAKIAGVPFEDIAGHKARTGQHHPLRKKIGKVAELASGYAGWIGAWKAFGADKHLTDDEIKQAILKWREESPAIVEFWGGQWRKSPGRWHFNREFYGLEGAAVMAVMHPGQCFSHLSISYGVKDGVLYCRLPSGRCLAYHEPELRPAVDPRGLEVLQLSFMGWDSEAHRWLRTDTYGGKLTENVVQAAARDLLAHALLQLDAAGYPVVLHVHDEACAEVPAGSGSVEEFEKIMAKTPPWAEGWPVKAAGGWRGRRYRK